MISWDSERVEAGQVGKIAWLASQIVLRFATCFPERQIYIRSQGRVQFYTIGQGFQATLAGLTAIFLAWVAFSTVTVVFKDRILAAQDHRIQQMQSAFEVRMADLQLSYESLLESATTARTRADRMVAAQSYKENAFRKVTNASFVLREEKHTQNTFVSRDARSAGGPGIVAVAVHWLFGRRQPLRVPVHNPDLDGIARDVAQLDALSRDATGVMQKIEEGASKAVTAEKQLMAATGLNADQFLHRPHSEEGVGGPEIPLDDVQIDGITDRSFSRFYLQAEANADELNSIHQAVLRLPAAAPVGAGVERSSGFGPRLDPFSGHYAFHPGVDFAGRAGTPVLATGSGRVTFAGREGSYGNMVELDHGDGLRTRYAHLLNIAVTRGQVVAEGSIVGYMGSTGRSTGPHVHYEVWFDNVVRNPDGFLRLGALEHQYGF